MATTAASIQRLDPLRILNNTTRRKDIFIRTPVRDIHALPPYRTSAGNPLRGSVYSRPLGTLQTLSRQAWRWLFWEAVPGGHLTRPGCGDVTVNLPVRVSQPCVTITCVGPHTWTGEVVVVAKIPDSDASRAPAVSLKRAAVERLLKRAMNEIPRP